MSNVKEIFDNFGRSFDGFEGMIYEPCWADKKLAYAAPSGVRKHSGA
jgi:hypothetical protein